MNSLDNQITQFIKKASKRIKLNFLLNLSIVALKYLLCLSFSLLLISLFITFPYVEEISIGIVIVGLIVTIIYGLIKGPDNRKVALIVDSKGLEERVTTALELIGKEDAISIAQKEDTVEAIKGYDIKKNLKITFDKKALLLLIGLLVISILTAFVPTTAKKNAEKIRDFNKYQNEMVKKVEEEKKKIDKVESLEEKEKEEIKKILEDAKKEIKESEKKTEINKTLERLEKKLQDKKEDVKSEEGKKALEESEKNLLEEFNKQKQDDAKKDLNKLVNELMKKKESEALAEAILSGDKTKVDNELSSLKKSLGNMSSAELSKVSEALKKAAEDISDEELSDTLNEASDSVMDGNLDTEKLSEALASAQNSSSGNNNGQQGQGNQQGQSNQQGQNGSNGQGQNGQGNNGGQGQGGSGGGPGQNGVGQSGTGWNTGSTVGTENDLENSRGEQVFIPGRGEGNDGNLSGNKNENGDSQQMETENGLNTSGSKVDYDKVIGDYTNSALDGINNSTLPESLKNLIKDYFQGLN